MFLFASPCHPRARWLDTALRSFYLTTKLNNPHYTPEISTKATICNFCVKQQGLEDQVREECDDDSEHLFHIHPPSMMSPLL